MVATARGQRPQSKEQDKGKRSKAEPLAQKAVGRAREGAAKPEYVSDALALPLPPFSGLWPLPYARCKAPVLRHLAVAGGRRRCENARPDVE
jgi:hypothetical protein